MFTSRVAAIAVGLTALGLTVAQPVIAGTDALFDGATAAGLCQTAYPDAPDGPDTLSPCQWDMGVVDADGAWDTATGAGVTVGVIDSGVDLSHPDLAGAIDVGLSCSFIYTRTPTADPKEIGNGTAATRPLYRIFRATARTSPPRSPAAPMASASWRGAPEATIVALKACTIAGYCFADSVAAALRYAGDQRLDVVNLSLFADPYLYYCKNDKEQRAILKTLESRRGTPSSRAC